MSIRKSFSLKRTLQKMVISFTIPTCLTKNDGGSFGDQIKKMTQQVHTKMVILGAGTFGTAGIMFRSRSKGLIVSKALGKNVSSNGNLITVAKSVDEKKTGIKLKVEGKGAYQYQHKYSGAIYSIIDTSSICN